MPSCHVLFHCVIPEVTARSHSERYQNVRFHVHVYIRRADLEACLERSAVLWVHFASQMGHNRLQITVSLTGIGKLLTGGEMDLQRFVLGSPVLKAGGVRKHMAG